jgi:hypothetical protein
VVRPESELVKVTLGIFRANVDMRRGNRLFEQAPKALDAIGIVHRIVAKVVIAPFLRAMLDHAVPCNHRRLVNHSSSVHPSRRLNHARRYQDHAAKRLLFDVRDHLGRNLSATFCHSHNNRLAFGAAPAFSWVMAADIGLIKFDMSLENFELTRRAHKFADLLAYAPRRLIGHAKRALQFLARYAVASDDEKIDRIEPRLQRRMTILKDRASAWVNVIATKGASERMAPRDLMESCFIAARAANVTQAIPNFHNAFQASIVISEFFKEFANRKLLNIADLRTSLALAVATAGHGDHARHHELFYNLCQGDNPQNQKTNPNLMKTASRAVQPNRGLCVYAKEALEFRNVSQHSIDRSGRRRLRRVHGLRQCANQTAPSPPPAGGGAVL